jgi:hypothetical protein
VIFVDGSRLIFFEYRPHKETISFIQC